MNSVYGISDESGAGLALSELTKLCESRGLRLERFQTNSQRSGFVIEGLHWVITKSEFPHRYFENSRDPRHSAYGDSPLAWFSLNSLEYKCPLIFARKLRKMITELG